MSLERLRRHVGGLDEQVIALNEQAMTDLGEVGELRVVPGATHLFEERGTLEQVAELAADWFSAWLSPAKHTGVHHERHTPSL